MAIAKGLGGGFPLGALLATEEAAKGMEPGTHGSTFGGNPLAMAVGNAVLDAIVEPGFLDSVRPWRCASSSGWRRSRTPIPHHRGGARQGADRASRSNRRWAEVVNAALEEKLLIRTAPATTSCACCRRSTSRTRGDLAKRATASSVRASRSASRKPT